MGSIHTRQRNRDAVFALSPSSNCSRYSETLFFNKRAGHQNKRNDSSPGTSGYSAARIVDKPHRVDLEHDEPTSDAYGFRVWNVGGCSYSGFFIFHATCSTSA